MLSIVVSACVQTSRTGSGLPENQGAGVVATSDPLVLNGVTYTQGAVTQPSNSSPPPTAGVVPVPAGNEPGPAVSSTPLPQSAPAPPPPVIASQPNVPPVPTTQPDAQPVPVTTADGYPNINLTPQQPQSKLLTPEERAKLIEELNALAGRSGAGQ